MKITRKYNGLYKGERAGYVWVTDTTLTPKRAKKKHAVSDETGEKKRYAEQFLGGIKDVIKRYYNPPAGERTYRSALHYTMRHGMVKAGEAWKLDGSRVRLAMGQLAAVGDMTIKVAGNVVRVCYNAVNDAARGADLVHLYVYDDAAGCHARYVLGRRSRGGADVVLPGNMNAYGCYYFAVAISADGLLCSNAVYAAATEYNGLTIKGENTIAKGGL